MSSKLKVIWGQLTEPCPWVQDPETRQKSHFLASLFIGLLPLSLLLIALPHIGFGALNRSKNNALLVLAVACILWVAPYIMARRGRYILATLWGSAIASAVVIAIAITDQSCENLYYLIMPLFLSSVIISVRATAWFAGITVLITALLPFAAGDLGLSPAQFYIGPFTFVSLNALLILLIVQHHNTLTAERRGKLWEHSQALEQQSVELARSNAFLRALSQVATRMMSAPDPDAIMQTMGQELHQLGLKSIVTLLEPGQEALIVRYTSIDSALMRAGEKMMGVSMLGFRMPREHFAGWDTVMVQGRPLFSTGAISFMSAAVPNVALDKIRSLTQLGGSRRSNNVIWLPLPAQQRITGTLVVWGPDLREHDIETLRIFAGQVATALETTRLYIAARARAEELVVAGAQLEKELSERRGIEAALQRSSRRLHVLYRLNQAIIAAASPETIAEAALSRIAQLTPQRSCAVISLDFEAKTATILAAHTEAELPMLARGAQLPLGSPYDQECLATALRDGEIQNVSDLAAAAQALPFLQAIQEAGGLRSLLLVPLLLQDNPIGMLALGAASLNAFGAEEVAIAREVADSLAVALQQSRLREELRLHATRLEAALREKEALLREIHHRVKNNLQVVSSLLQLQTAHIQDENALELLRASRSRVHSMALVHEQLYQSHDLAHVDLNPYLTRLAANLFHAYGATDAGIRLHTDVEDVTLGIDSAIPCGLILNELLTNALKHAFPAGSPGDVSISLHAAGRILVLEVRDNGVGLPEHLDFRSANSMGLQLINTLVTQLDGTIELDRRDGTAFAIRFSRDGD